MYYFIPNVFGHSTFYCWSFVVGVLYAQLPTYKPSRNNKSLILSILLIIIGTIIYILISDKYSTFLSIKGGYWAYTFITNIISLVMMFSITYIY